MIPEDYWSRWHPPWVPISTRVAELAKEVEDQLALLGPDAVRTFPANPDAVQTVPTHGGIGHNNPPVSTPLSVKEHAEMVEAIQRISREALAEQPNATEVTQAVEVLNVANNKVLAWLARKADLTVDEFAKQIGKTVGDVRFLAAVWLITTGKIDALLHAIKMWVQ